MPAWDASVSCGSPGRPFLIGGKAEAGKGTLSCSGRVSEGGTGPVLLNIRMRQATGSSLFLLHVKALQNLWAEEHDKLRYLLALLLSALGKRVAQTQGDRKC